MKLSNKKIIPFLFILLFQIISCTASLPKFSNHKPTIHLSKLNGGSSGMEKIDDQSFLVVYDIKSHRAGTRLAMLKITTDELLISPINISGWGEEGIASDLESICKIPEKPNEFFIAESGNWEGKIGRIFHIQVDTANLTAQVLGITKLPFEYLNNLDIVGDQYEAISCLPYSKNERILILGERGGSVVNPRGIIRWGVYDLRTHQLNFSPLGIKGIAVNAPGEWINESEKRDITDLHIDSVGGIWASASEDISELGPFYSVIYKIGQVDSSKKEQPFDIYNTFTIWNVVAGFKIEALSGPVKNINSTHSFGTEDELYGGVWRPIFIK